MFGVVIQLGERLKALNRDSLMHTVMNDRTIQAEAIDLNQSQLYDKGVDSKGSPTGTYSVATIYGTTKFEGKIEKGQRYDHVTLNDTGDFYKSMKVKNENDGFVITGDFPNMNIELGWPDALGLTEESKAELIPAVKDGLIEQIKYNLLK